MRLVNSTWPQVEAYFAEHDTVMLLFGSTEQHGRHNPLGTDIFAPQKLSELVEEQLPDLLIAPILPFGSTPRFTEFPGTIDLGDDLLYQVVTRICSCLYNYGARHFVFLNGHGGNTKSLTNAQLDLARRGCRCALLDWWKMCGDFDPAWAGGHGGGQETSAMLYVCPELVDRDAIDDMQLIDDAGPDMPTMHFDTVKFKGVSVQLTHPTREYAANGWIGPDHPKDATAAWGEEMLTTVAAWMVEFIEAFEQVPLPA